MGPDAVSAEAKANMGGPGICRFVRFRSMACQLLFPTPLWTFVLPAELSDADFAAAVLP